MRKVIAICFALLIATSALASPRNESQDSGTNPVTRIVRQIKKLVHHVFDDPVSGVPVPH